MSSFPVMLLCLVNCSEHNFNRAGVVAVVKALVLDTHESLNTHQPLYIESIHNAGGLGLKLQHGKFLPRPMSYQRPL